MIGEPDMPSQNLNLVTSISLLSLMLGTVLTIPMQEKLIGYLVLSLGAFLLAYTPRAFRRDIGLIFLSIAIIGITPISTDIGVSNFLIMGSLLAMAVIIPFVVTRFVYKEKSINFFLAKHVWTKKNIGYIVLALLLSYLILPFWMKTTGGYQNWTVLTDPYHLIVLFIGTNGLGIWDELFFIVTVLALLRRHLPFYQANLIQAVLFTSFLYELGFRGWAPLVIYPFALLQGMIFRRTENLIYVIAIHLTIDLVLYLALISAHHPDLLPIFITN